jgi:plastocyanin
MHRRSLVLALIAAFAVVGCGSYASAPASPSSSPASPAATTSGYGDYGATTTAPAATTVAPTAATATGPATATPTKAPAGGSPTTAPAGAGAAVAIVDFGFNAADITVKVGTTVTWTNTGQRPHTVTSTDSGFTSSGTLGNGSTYAVTFQKAGTFAYVCSIHGSMKGTVTVTP